MAIDDDLLSKDIFHPVVVAEAAAASLSVSSVPKQKRHISLSCLLDTHSTRPQASLAILAQEQKECSRVICNAFQRNALLCTLCINQGQVASNQKWGGRGTGAKKLTFGLEAKFNDHLIAETSKTKFYKLPAEETS